MKRILTLSLAALLLLSCGGDYKNPWPESLLNLSVRPVYPDAFTGTTPESGTVKAEEMTTGALYKANTDRDGIAEMALPAGMYRVSFSARTGQTLLNGSKDRVLVTEDRALDLPLDLSEAGSIVIKELYVGGCSKAPEEGTYQSDQYVLLHNNDSETAYLDSLCFGTLSPYNATGTNSWLIRDPETGDLTFPDFVPVVTVVWRFPGNGRTWPLQPGEDALIALRGAIDHSAAYPLSVNLNRSDCFVCYNPTYFPNPLYHPAPGDKVRQDHILEVLIKTGQSNANTISMSSPTFVIFKSRGITMEDYLLQTDAVRIPAGNSADRSVIVPYAWLIDAVEVFDGRSSNNAKRLSPKADAGFVYQSDVFKSRSVVRKKDEEASREAGYEILQDTNNSSTDFYESEAPTLRR